MLRALRRRWDAYKYRFVPWLALNLRRKRRTLRYVPESSQDKIISDEDVFETLLKVFKALFINDFSRHAHILALLPEIKCTVYRKHEPIFFQSLGNPFIFRCIDGVLIDGNDKGLSRSVYRSCSRRDQLGPFQMSDESWLTAALQNPLAVGQYVNNCSHEKAANVCYQEFDVPGYFPVELKQYLPNIVYSHNIERLAVSQRAHSDTKLTVCVKKKKKKKKPPQNNTRQTWLKNNIIPYKDVTQMRAPVWKS
ncbi:SET domain-containing protein 9 isoform X3 [Accipiter gentilis]|uniref:SET domain-containing protein 9 isoform X3 n=1 Tax=Astur gentilis TaxID=8957 RepID=UPI00210F8679|nr:SET domain-containing protein 9 isoform X3 [Accipiter gentilis]